jgi:predicted phage terminase large subunit-like protein
MAFKDTKDSAYVVGEVWAEEGANSYLLDQVREKMDIVATVDAVKLLTKRWPQALRKLVEDKANGTAVIRMLRNQIAGLTEVEPKGGKEARANAAAPVARSGNVYLPHPSVFPWVNEFLDETEAFPAGTYADQVDSATQYLNERYKGMPITDLRLPLDIGAAPSYWNSFGGVELPPHLSSGHE